MSTEPELRATMQRMLAPLSPSWVAEKVGVTRQQVDRWKNGHYVSERRVEAVAAAIRSLLPDAKESAPADERLERIESGIGLLLERAGISDAEWAAAQAEVREAADRLLGPVVEAPRRSGGAGPSPAKQTSARPASAARRPADRS